MECKIEALAKLPLSGRSEWVMKILFENMLDKRIKIFNIRTQKTFDNKMQYKLSGLSIIMLLIAHVASAQKRIVVVDGFFIKQDSNFVAEYLGEILESVELIPADSARHTFGDWASGGMVIFKTKEREDERSKFFRKQENLLFDDLPKFLLNNQPINQEELKSLDPEKIEKIEVLHPLSAVRIYGPEMRGGLIMITGKSPNNDPDPSGQ